MPPLAQGAVVHGACARCGGMPYDIPRTVDRSILGRRGAGTLRADPSSVVRRRKVAAHSCGTLRVVGRAISRFGRRTRPLPVPYAGAGESRSRRVPCFSVVDYFSKKFRNFKTGSFDVYKFHFRETVAKNWRFFRNIKISARDLSKKRSALFFSSRFFFEKNFRDFKTGSFDLYKFHFRENVSKNCRFFRNI